MVSRYEQEIGENSTLKQKRHRFSSVVPGEEFSLNDMVIFSFWRAYCPLAAIAPTPSGCVVVRHAVQGAVAAEHTKRHSRESKHCAGLYRPALYCIMNMVGRLSNHAHSDSSCQPYWRHITFFMSEVSTRRLKNVTGVRVIRTVNACRKMRTYSTISENTRQIQKGR